MFNQIVKTVGSFLGRNSTTILTSTAVVGVVSTAVLTARAAYQHASDYERDRDLGITRTRQEEVKEYWKLYIPAAVTGAVTIGCIIGAHNIGSRKNAALVSAYSLVDRAFTEYRTKVVETIGEKKAEEIRDAVTDDRIKQLSNTSQTFIVGEGEQLCYESLTGRYFKSTAEVIRRAENTLNARMNHGVDYGVQLNDLYSLIGLSPTTMGDEMGWNVDTLLKIKISSHLTEDEKPCLALTYDIPPFPKYWKVNL